MDSGAEQFEDQEGSPTHGSCLQVRERERESSDKEIILHVWSLCILSKD